MNRGCGRESKGVCGALEGPWKVMVRLPEPLPTLLPRPDCGPVLWRPPKQQGLEVRSPLVPRTPLQFQTPAECAPPPPWPGGGSLGSFPALRSEACGVSSERLFSIHGATQSLPHLLSTASPVI